jgi:hypothetical protein
MVPLQRRSPVQVCCAVVNGKLDSGFGHLFEAAPEWLWLLEPPNL